MVAKRNVLLENIDGNMVIITSVKASELQLSLAAEFLVLLKPWRVIVALSLSLSLFFEQLVLSF